MHIKRIVIQGFKTYKNTTTVEDLSPGHNVVVGRNGSGKSNFFAAIRFVLSDQYTRMTKEERQGLIHEGSGSVLSAYVEIVFDNSDGRFPTGKDEVVIRRTIGLKKDDYSLDFKSSTRVDVMQLLESAGFSKSNPYYIVPQGRITSLTNAKDTERLNLLKEVAGAKVFENKLRESQKEMDKTKNQREKIDEMLTFIEDRLSDLDAEKDELKNFQELEKKKKIFEYKLHDHELNEITTSIEEIDSDYQNALENSDKFVENLERGESTAQEIIKSIDSTESELKMLKIDQQQTTSIATELSKSLYEKKATLRDLTESLESQQQIIKKNEMTLEKLEKRRSKNQELLSSKRPRVEKLREQEMEFKTSVATLATKQNLLCSKQGRYSKFNSKAQRDSWIKSQIKELTVQKTNKENQVRDNKGKISSYETELQQLITKADSLQDQLYGPTAQQEINTIEDQIAEVKQQLTIASDERKDLWRDARRCQEVLGQLKDEMSKSERGVSHTMDRQLHLGLQAVNRIKSRLGLSGVYGTLGELIDVNHKYRTAVEVIAGNQLFQVIVDNDETATTLMDELVREKAGRVTFMPLNRLNPKNHTYPDSNDCVPLIKKLSYDANIEKAVKQVFGKTIVTVNLDRGYELSRDYDLNAITLDGDKADKKGMLTGGYHDFKTSRLVAMKMKKVKAKALRDQEEMALKLKLASDKKGQQITKLTDDLSKLHSQLEKVNFAKKDIKTAHSNVLGDKFKTEQNIKLLQEQISDSMKIINTLNTKIEDYKNELESPLQQGLTSEQKEELKNTTQALAAAEKGLNEISDELLKEESELMRLESELEESIMPRLKEIVKSSKTSDQTFFDEQIVKLTEEVENLSEQLQSAEATGEEQQETIDVKTNEVKKLKDTLDKTNEQQRKLVRSFENFQKNTERSLSKRQVLLKRRDETQAKIRQLGTLPDTAFDETHSYERDVLLRKLNEVTEGLEKFSHVNRKALEQYLNFTKQRDNLAERRKELDQSEESIVDLMGHLSERKNEAIEKTFSEVSKAFSEVFEKLVPKGTGKLIMQKKSKETQELELEEESDHEMDDEDPEHSIVNYSGVSIQVSFNSKSDEQQRIEQLSGGQKSLCAIALILAIQKSDPAPFYLFDEIDANLDTQYRTAVANMILELSEKAQFICTTFRPEMLQVANKFFGVSFNNKISSVGEIDQALALGFVEGEQARS